MFPADSPQPLNENERARKGVYHSKEEKQVEMEMRNRRGGGAYDDGKPPVAQRIHPEVSVLQKTLSQLLCLAWRLRFSKVSVSPLQT